MSRQTTLFTEVGGGIRDEKRISAYLEVGVNRVILGTVALENPAFVGEMAAKYGGAIAVSVDAKKGKVAVRGWESVSEADSVTFCRQMEDLGVETIIYTDISKDGKMAGTNLAIYQTLSEALSVQIIASGGITYLEEIEKLRRMNLYGAIVGKSLYENGLSLPEVLKEADKKC